MKHSNQSTYMNMNPLTFLTPTDHACLHELARHAGYQSWHARRLKMVQYDRWERCKNTLLMEWCCHKTYDDHWKSVINHAINHEVEWNNTYDDENEKKLQHFIERQLHEKHDAEVRKHQYEDKIATLQREREQVKNTLNHHRERTAMERKTWKAARKHWNSVQTMCDNVQREIAEWETSVQREAHMHREIQVCEWEIHIIRKERERAEMELEQLQRGMMDAESFIRSKREHEQKHLEDHIEHIMNDALHGELGEPS